jgi:hypothetical protein
MRKIDDAIAGLAPVSLHTKDHVSLYALNCHLSVSAADTPADGAVLKHAVDAALQSWSKGADPRRRDCKKPWNLWDALAIVTQTISTEPGRRVVLVVTDGLDRGSKTSWDSLRDFAQGKGVAIFGLVQPADLGGLFRSGLAGQANFFNTLCESTGGMVLTSTSKDLPGQLKWFTMLLRDRYIVEFPKPVDTTGGRRDMDITVDRIEAFIRPAGIAVPVDDPAILNDPLTISSDPSHAPQLGKRKAVAGK